jgi:hypothetical protein
MPKVCTMKDKTRLFDMRSPCKINSARNANQGSIWAYHIFGRFAVTGLIGAFLVPFFRITGLRA